jgi:hypothetical protein
MHLGQDPKIRNGKNKLHFWDRVFEDYNKNRVFE